MTLLGKIPSSGDCGANRCRVAFHASLEAVTAIHAPRADERRTGRISSVEGGKEEQMFRVRSICRLPDELNRNPNVSALPKRAD